MGLLILVGACRNKKEKEDSKHETWTFVSIPDFLNVDCDYPQKGWEDALSYILQSVKAEQPDFVVVPGDLVMGHWNAPKWNSGDTIRKYSDKYYSAWKERMRHHGLKYFTSIGDHEVGDNPWLDSSKLQAVSLYKDAFARHLNMPGNGPEHLKGTAFWWKHKNVLFISVDVFEKGESDQGLIRAGVTGKQLQWMRKVLKQNSGADHRIVLGHSPVLGPVRKWSTSGLMLSGGRSSDFWQLMDKYDVDAYLCGEVHAITCTYRDGIMQVAHGGLIGYNSRTNYMVIQVSEDKIDLKIKEIEMELSGDKLWQTKHNRPLQNVSIKDKNEGFYLSGTATINKIQGRQILNRKGYFLRKYEKSSEEAWPVFRKGNNKNMPVSLPRIEVKE